jgi:aldehyde:ferredoxin oxidoreductase
MATSNVGANHSIGYCWQELFNLAFPRPVDRFAEKGNADIAKLNQDQFAMYELGVMCFFPFSMNMAPALLFSKMLAEVTGIPEFGAPGYLLRVGEKIYNLERAFNLREGFGRKDDAFPKRITTEPLKNAGPAEGQFISNPEGMLDEYYQVRGWDEEGVPSTEKLMELGLEEIIKDVR